MILLGEWKEVFSSVFESTLVDEAEQETVLTEKDTEGRACLNLTLANPCIVFRNMDKHKISLFRVKNCADHFIFENSDRGWILHIIEMKKTVYTRQWRKIKNQFEGGLLHAITFARLLEIDLSLDKVYLYTAYRNDKFNDKGYSKANPVKMHSAGNREEKKEKREWNSEKVTINCITPYCFIHKKIRLDSEGNGTWAL